MRRTVGIVLVLLACAAAAATAGGQGESKGAAPAGGGGGLFGKPVTLSMMFTSHPSYPYQTDWYIFQAIEKKTGVKIEGEGYGDNYNEKLQLKLASGNLNDMTYVGDMGQVIRYGGEGAFVELLGNIGKLPNFAKWKTGRDNYMTNYQSMDGKLYVFPNEGIGDVDLRAWMYRKDIFDKHSLKPPKDFDEFYTTARKLKELYPSSYPYTFRSNLGHFSLVGAQWGTGWMLYFNNRDDRFAYGPVDNDFRDMVAWFARLYKEKLIPPDFMSLNTNGWQNIVSTDNAFMLADYLLRIDFFQSAIKPNNPAFTLKYMSPPKGTSAGGVPKVFPTVSIWGYSVAAGSKKVEEALKYLDWMFSPEGADLTCWGEENVTYKILNGRRHFTIKGEPAKGILDVCKEYGLHTVGSFLVIDPQAEIGGSGASAEMLEAFDAVGKDTLGKPPAINFASDEQKAIQDILGPINTTVQEELAKFVLGTRPMSEWDAYVKKIESLGISKVLDKYNTAYQKMKKK